MYQNGQITQNRIKNEKNKYYISHLNLSSDKTKKNIKIYPQAVQRNSNNKNITLKINTFFKAAGHFFILFLNTSSIHGLNHLTSKSRHPVEIFIWLVFLGAALFGAVSLSYTTWVRYQENPTVISMERDRFSWNTSFPAATICPTFKINQNQLIEYLKRFEVPNRNEIKRFVESLASGTYKNFNQIPSTNLIKNNQYLKVLLDLEFDFFPSVSNSGANGNLYKLQKVMTEMGICYSFNSKLAIYNSPDYWFQNRWDLVEGNGTFYVHPLDGEVFANVVNMSTGFDLYIHGPYEVVDIASKGIYSENGYFLQVYLTGLSLFTSTAAKNLKIGQRKCRFPDESNLPHSPAYSYTLCRIECRIQLAKKLCGCLPHFYRKLEDEEYCDVPGLHCLQRHAELLMKLTKNNATKNSRKLCNCLPNCDEVTYVVEDLDTRQWFLGSNLQWGLKEYPRMRLKRDVLFGFTDLLVYVGGMAGLFLGCSVLSFAEIVYFFTIHLFWFVIDYGRKTKPIIVH